MVFAVFVKPWRSLSLPALAKHIRSLGFDWIELPIRPGFPCEPDTIETSLPEAVHILGEEGIQVLNVTADFALDDERLYAACAQSGIRLNRVMFNRRAGENYWEAEKKARFALDSSLELCRRYDFQIGVQNHSGHNVPNNAMGLHNLLKDYDPRSIGAIWDPAHNALEGENSEPALDIVADHLSIVNLKNAYWKAVDSPNEETTQWQVYWTTGRKGRASWPIVAQKLKTMGYLGPVCLSAEYSEPEKVNEYIREDLSFARQCFQG